jgi:hypothetical protein
LQIESGDHLLPNALGYQVAAQEILEHLTKTGFLDPP